MIDGQEIEFGTAGYTLNNVFVLYDRATDSVWYPGENETLEAVAGEKRGSSISFLDEPDPQPLGSWLAAQPDSAVLLPSQEDWNDLKRPRMGLRFTDRKDALELRRVVDEGPAALAGLEQGDVLLRLDGRPVADRESINEILDGLQGGAKVGIVYRRGQMESTTQLTLRPGRG